MKTAARDEGQAEAPDRWWHRESACEPYCHGPRCLRLVQPTGLGIKPQSAPLLTATRTRVTSLPHRPRRASLPHSYAAKAQVIGAVQDMVEEGLLLPEDVQVRVIFRLRTRRPPRSAAARPTAAVPICPPRFGARSLNPHIPTHSVSSPICASEPRSLRQPWLPTSSLNPSPRTLS